MTCELWVSTTTARQAFIVDDGKPRLTLTSLCRHWEQVLLSFVCLKHQYIYLVLPRHHQPPPDRGWMAEKSKVCERIAEIDGCFGVSGQTLAVKGRVLIAEGVLTKSCRSGVKARQFFLFNDILVSTRLSTSDTQSFFHKKLSTWT